jgi:hypothetical protein
MTRDAADVGRIVLASLARGREKLLEKRRDRLRLLAQLVDYEARRDVALGLPPRGRASRIARRLARAAPERTIRRVFANLHSASLPKCPVNSAKLPTSRGCTALVEEPHERKNHDCNSDRRRARA